MPNDKMLQYGTTDQMSKIFVRFYALCATAHAPKDIKEGCTRSPHKYTPHNYKPLLLNFDSGSVSHNNCFFF